MNQSNHMGPLIDKNAVDLYLKFIFNNSSSSELLSSTNMQINQIIKAEVDVKGLKFKASLKNSN